MFVTDDDEEDEEDNVVEVDDEEDDDDDDELGEEEEDGDEEEDEEEGDEEEVGLSYLQKSNLEVSHHLISTSPRHTESVRLASTNRQDDYLEN